MFTELVQCVAPPNTPIVPSVHTHTNKLLLPPAAFCRLKASSWQMFLSAARAPVAEWRCWEQRTTASTLKPPAEKHCVWQKWSAIGGFARYLQGSRYERWFSIGQAIRTHANSRDWKCLFIFLSDYNECQFGVSPVLPLTWHWSVTSAVFSLSDW